MDIQPDFRELLESFNAHEVEYLVVGGFALAFHGAPRFTGDLDLFVRPDPANARKVLTALAAFGFGDLGLTQDDFIRDDSVVQLGVSPVRIDLLTSLTGVTWDDASRGRSPGELGGVAVAYIGIEDFVANKRSTGRLKDLADLEALGEQ
jgi:predicted nucleotidyltransferase